MSMAATVTGIHLESAGITTDPDDESARTLRTHWVGTLIATGAPAPVDIETDVAGVDLSQQPAWDPIWTAVLAAYTSIYANSPTVSPQNPVDLPGGS
jgi:hypothetical protein